VGGRGREREREKSNNYIINAASYVKTLSRVLGTTEVTDHHVVQG